MASAPKPSESSNDIKPTTRGDLQIRMKHTRDSIRYNEAHARDHALALKKAKTQLKQTQAALIKLPRIK